MKVNVVNGIGMIFSPEDGRILRENHRLTGNMIGSFSRKPRQNLQLGMPIQLLPEEVTLLKEKGLADIVISSSKAKTPTDKEVTDYKAHVEQVFKDQEKLCHDAQKADRERFMEKIIEGKKAKRRKLMELKKEKGEQIDSEEEKEPEITLDEIQPSPVPRNMAYVQIPTAAWRDLDEDKDPSPWTFPSTESEKLRYRVFKEFWEKGYYLTSGGKFGGDFLVYPGDPARYHSFFIAVCVPYQQKLTALHIANMGRLGVTVKKTVVLCSVNDRDELSCTSVNWSHIS